MHTKHLEAFSKLIFNFYASQLKHDSFSLDGHNEKLRIKMLIERYHFFLIFIYFYEKSTVLPSFIRFIQELNIWIIVIKFYKGINVVIKRCLPLWNE